MSIEWNLLRSNDNSTWVVYYWQNKKYFLISKQKFSLEFYSLYERKVNSLVYKISYSIFLALSLIYEFIYEGVREEKR